ncbi:FecR family protein, partial [Bacteroides caccae]
ILLFLLVSPLRDFTGEKVNVMLTDVQSVRLDTIQDVQLIIGEKKTIAMAEDADISWTKEDEIEVNGRSSNSTYKSRIDADVTYSTLLVPYGKRSFLTLRDGTKVWINSGTEVRFPVNMEGKERSIYVDGEIYIEVAKDKERPFYVHTSGFDVRVYGTKFNVTSYKADKEKSVVLVEGSVSVCSKEETKEKEVKEIFLHPDQMYHTTNRGPMITHVNALQYITWKDGIWQFTSESLESIALRLSRYYGVDIHCDEKTAVKSCTGKLILFDDVDKTLRIIEEIFGVRYETNQNEIIISMNP